MNDNQSNDIVDAIDRLTAATAELALDVDKL
jgi:hypothetical protein